MGLTRESLQGLLEQAATAPAPPLAIEAFWDGDSNGWRVTLCLIYSAPEATGLPYRSHGLATMQGASGDQALQAIEAGQELAARLCVPFYFPSPSHPEDDCPRWWEQDQGYPCRRCGILLLQPTDCRWRGICYFCHIDEEREKKEAAWSPEERAGPRCHICGNPGKGTLNAFPACSECLALYEEYRCPRCESIGRIVKSGQRPDACSHCTFLERLGQVSEAHREAIRAAVADSGRIAGIRAARDLLGWSMHDALWAIHEWSLEDTPLSTNDGDEA